jgi:hypothetical protein
MRYWTGLYPGSTQQAINEGVDLMIRMAIRLLGKQKKRRLMLTDGRYSSKDSDDRGGSETA